MARASGAPGPDLFSAAVEDRLARRAPLAARMRPVALDDVVGQRHLLAPGRPLRVLLESDRLSSLILWGPPGTGKTTIAKLIAGATAKAFESLSAVSAGVKDVREIAERARARLGEHGPGHDPVPRRGPPLQPRPARRPPPVRRGGPARLRRCDHREPVLLAHRPAALAQHALPSRAARRATTSTTLVDRALTDTERGLGDEPVDHRRRRPQASRRPQRRRRAPPPHRARGRARPHRRDSTATRSRSTTPKPRSRSAACATATTSTTTSSRAFIKSIRGSDPDAGLYWLARMIEAGEDPRYIARRLVILASEDVGLADSNALVVADAAARAVEFVGMPEAGLNLAHAVLHLALAPKSNSVKASLLRTLDAVQNQQVRARSRSTCGTAATAARAMLGHGKGYVYPHDDPTGWVPQQHLPPEVAGERFYRPSSHGAEPRTRRAARATNADEGSSRRRWRRVTSSRSSRDGRRDPRRARSSSRWPPSCSTLRELRATVDALREDTLALLDDAHDAVRAGRRSRSTASTDSSRRPSASTTRSTARRSMAYKTLASPVVKAMAFGTGVSRAAHRLREGEPPAPTRPAAEGPRAAKRAS